MKRRVVVTGLGSVTSLACQVDELWKRLLNGESGVHPLRIIEGIDRFKVRFGGDVYDWQPEKWPDITDMPAAACILFDHGKPTDRTIEDIQKHLDFAYAKNLY